MGNFFFQLLTQQCCITTCHYFLCKWPLSRTTDVHVRRMPIFWNMLGAELEIRATNNRNLQCNNVAWQVDRKFRMLYFSWAWIEWNHEHFKSLSSIISLFNSSNMRHFKTLPTLFYKTYCTLCTYPVSTNLLNLWRPTVVLCLVQRCCQLAASFTRLMPF